MRGAGCAGQLPTQNLVFPICHYERSLLTVAADRADLSGRSSVRPYSGGSTSYPDFPRIDAGLSLALKRGALYLFYLKMARSAFTRMIWGASRVTLLPAWTGNLAA